MTAGLPRGAHHPGGSGTTAPPGRGRRPHPLLLTLTLCLFLTIGVPILVLATMPPVHADPGDDRSEGPAGDPAGSDPASTPAAEASDPAPWAAEATAALQQLLGVGGSIAIQKLTAKEVNWAQAAGSGVIGGVTGGVGTLTGLNPILVSTRPWVQGYPHLIGQAGSATTHPFIEGAVTAAVPGVLLGMVNRILHGDDPWDPFGIAIDLTTSGLVGGVGGRLGARFPKTVAVRLVPAGELPPRARFAAFWDGRAVDLLLELPEEMNQPALRLSMANALVRQAASSRLAQSLRLADREAQVSLDLWLNAHSHLWRAAKLVGFNAYASKSLETGLSALRMEMGTSVLPLRVAAEVAAVGGAATAANYGLSRLGRTTSPSPTGDGRVLGPRVVQQERPARSARSTVANHEAHARARPRIRPLGVSPTDLAPGSFLLDDARPEHPTVRTLRMALTGHETLAALLGDRQDEALEPPDLDHLRTQVERTGELVHALLAAVSDFRLAHAFNSAGRSSQAQRVATVGEDRNDYHTEFGPTNVALHAVAVAVELGDAGEAVDASPLRRHPDRHELVDLAARNGWTLGDVDREVERRFAARYLTRAAG